MHPVRRKTECRFIASRFSTAQTTHHCWNRIRAILHEPALGWRGSAFVFPTPDGRYSDLRIRALHLMLPCSEVLLPAASNECVIACNWKDELLHRFADRGSLRLQPNGCVLERCSSGAKPGMQKARGEVPLFQAYADYT